MYIIPSTNRPADVLPRGVFGQLGIVTAHAERVHHTGDQQYDKVKA